MPRQLSPDEARSIEDAAIASMPPGLSEQDFHRALQPKLAAAFAEAENLPGPQGPAMRGLMASDDNATGLDAIKRNYANATAALRDTPGAILDTINPVKVIPSLLKMALDPNAVGAAIRQGAIDQGGKAKDAFSQGRYAEAAGHGLAAALPAIGPAAANAGEKIGAGDIEGGVAEGSALLAGPAAGRVAGAVGNRVLKTVSNLSRRGAERFVKGSLKTDRGYLKKMAGQGIIGKEEELARDALDLTDASTVTPGWTGKSLIDELPTLIDERQAARSAKVAAAPQVPDTQAVGEIRGVLGSARREARKGLVPQEDMAAINALRKDVMTGPTTTEVYKQRVDFRRVPKPDARAEVLTTFPGEPVRRLKALTPIETEQSIGAGNKRLFERFGEVKNDARVKAELALQRAQTDSLDRTSGTGQLSNEMRRLIDLDRVSNIAGRRIDSTNPLSLTDFISGSLGRWPILAGSQAMKGNHMMRVARKLDQLGKTARAADLTAPSVSAALLQQALQEQMQR